MQIIQHAIKNKIKKEESSVVQTKAVIQCYCHHAVLDLCPTLDSTVGMYITWCLTMTPIFTAGTKVFKIFKMFKWMFVKNMSYRKVVYTYEKITLKRKLRLRTIINKNKQTWLAFWKGRNHKNKKEK